MLFFRKTLFHQFTIFKCRSIFPSLSPTLSPFRHTCRVVPNHQRSLDLSFAFLRTFCNFLILIFLVFVRLVYSSADSLDSDLTLVSGVHNTVAHQPGGPQVTTLVSGVHNTVNHQPGAQVVCKCTPGPRATKFRTGIILMISWRMKCSQLHYNNNIVIMGA